MWAVTICPLEDIQEWAMQLTLFYEKRQEKYIRKKKGSAHWCNLVVAGSSHDTYLKNLKKPVSMRILFLKKLKCANNPKYWKMILYLPSFWTQQCILTHSTLCFSVCDFDGSRFAEN
eukprot:TRINITY_DN9933_c0_g4_i1.p1 TRINITY_DN9933_c0_g4~~TRINITY_DN9933_c0_g4_i1.p1  ORF type:complete len:117 (+),score=11.42 TRINITY_DN9933_c0_g4_i1:1136-1486(+)